MTGVFNLQLKTNIIVQFSFKKNISLFSFIFHAYNSTYKIDLLDLQFNLTSATVDSLV